MANKIPQIIAIVTVSSDGKISLKKDVKEHLIMKEGQNLFLDVQNEIILSTKKKGEEVALMKGNRIRLPKKALTKLDITKGELVGFAQRKNAVAIKKVEIVENEGEIAKIYDLETSHMITRVTETNPMPEKLLAILKQQYKGLKLKYDVKQYLKGRQTLEGWKARKILKISEDADEELRKELIEERLENQSEDGSWQGSVVLTARYLKELAGLGIGRDNAKIRRAVGWLLNRPQSPYNPGMFFVKDELVKEQEEVINRREKKRKGKLDRFRKRLSSEIRLVKAGDDLIRDPCGPRIMWPTALVLEALLKLGYEKDERVQTASHTLMLGRWCECAYQHGLSYRSGIKRNKRYSMKEIEEIERNFIEQYRYGGMGSLRQLEKKDLAYKVGTKMPRIAHSSKSGVDEYLLKMHEALPGCDFITTRALSWAENESVRRLAEAHLWKFAATQDSDGKFRGRRVERFLHSPQVAYLNLFARYDHPISKIVIMRATPWIVNNQNKDGSWGDESNKDISTLVVIEALKNAELI